MKKKNEEFKSLEKDYDFLLSKYSSLRKTTDNKKWYELIISYFIYDYSALKHYLNKITRGQ